MNLQGYRDTFYFFTGKVSDISRQLAFAGIAIIWIFKKDVPGTGLTVPRELLLPGVFIVLALGFDLLQYCIATVIWFFYYRIKEMRGVAENAELGRHLHNLSTLHRPAVSPRHGENPSRRVGADLLAVTRHRAHQTAMLALDDGAALARICIGASRIPQSQWRRWLKQARRSFRQCRGTAQNAAASCTAASPSPPFSANPDCIGRRREAAMAALAKSWPRGSSSEIGKFAFEGKADVLAWLTRCRH